MDEFTRLRRGLPPEDDKPERDPDSILRLCGYSADQIAQIHSGVHQMLLRPKPVENDLEWTLEGLDDLDPACLPDRPREIEDRTVSELPVQSQPKPGGVSGLPSNAVQSEPPVTASNQPPTQDEIQRLIARRLLPDSSLSDLEYRTRYGRDRNQQDTKPVAWTPPPDTGCEGWGGGMLDG